MIDIQIGANATGVNASTKGGSLHRRAEASAIALIAILAVLAIPYAARPASPAQKSLPYTTIDHPEFIAASQATFLSKDDYVMGVSDGKVAKAYPLAILAQHGVVQDRVADGPVAVTY
jgi:hypothetical protein